MTPVFQTIVDKDHGNCMQAAIASLFDLKLEDVPNFKELGDNWFSEMYSFVQTQGYKMEPQIFNKGYSTLCTPTFDCFKKAIWHRASIMTPKRLYRESGVNGYFYAGVYSPNNFRLQDSIPYTHAVIIDRDYNIVHDPNPAYKDILGYPLRSLIGYNGVIDVNIINPIS